MKHSQLHPKKKHLHAVKQDQSSNRDTETVEELPIKVLTVKGDSTANGVTTPLGGQPIKKKQRSCAGGTKLPKSLYSPSMWSKRWWASHGLKRFVWMKLNAVSVEETGLSAVLTRHEAVFKDELRSMNKISVKLQLKPVSQPKFMKARKVPELCRQTEGGFWHTMAGQYWNPRDGPTQWVGHTFSPRDQAWWLWSSVWRFQGDH